MTRAFIFPGQGSQSIGMGKDLFDNFAEARAVFEEIDESLSQKLSALMFDGEVEDLNLTENTQPALMAVSVAVMRVLETQGGIQIAESGAFAAGHSLGEYSALTAAGAFALSDAAKLLKLRGQAMQRAVPVGEGAMAAVLGLSFEDVESITQDAGCEIANDNSDGQVVISGRKDAVDKACEIAKEKGAKRALILPVSAPFHCSLMQPAAGDMRDALADVTINAPALPIVANITAEAADGAADTIRDLLVNQITGRVRWRESVHYMKAQGVEQMLEIGSGKVLSGLVRRIEPDVTCMNAGNPAEIEALLEAMNG